MKTLLLLFLLISLVACETILEEIPNSKLPRPDVSLVIASFISPQDLSINVKVTESTPLFSDYKSSNLGFFILDGDTVLNDGSNVVSNAIVTLESSKKKSVNLRFDKEEQIYTVSTALYQIEAGETYTLKVSSNGRVAQATCTVPANRALIKSYVLDSTSQIDFGIERKGYKLKMKWDDIAKELNSYRVRAYAEFEYLEPLEVSNGKVIYQLNISKTPASWNNQFTDEAAYINDQNLDGKSLQSPLGLLLPNVFSRRIVLNGVKYEAKITQKKPKITMELLTLDTNYKQYHLSILKHENAEGNPFAEPYSVFSNVKGGLGCFGATNRDIVVIEE
jgi:hypothetical protein